MRADYFGQFRLAKRAPEIVRVLALIIATLVVLFPIIWMLLTSFKTFEELFFTNNPSFIPRKPTLVNYWTVLTTTTFLTNLLNSTLVAISTTISTVFLSLFGAYSLSKYRWPGRQTTSRLILFTYMVPAILLIIPIFLTIDRLGLINSLWSLVIIEIAFALPFSIWLLKGFFDGLPDEILDAALIDGCSKLSAFRHVLLPLAAPGIIAATMFTLILSWNDFIWALTFIDSEEKWTLPLRLAWYLGPQVGTERWGPMNAEAMLVALPMFVVFWFLQRYMVEGLSVGSVK